MSEHHDDHHAEPHDHPHDHAVLGAGVDPDDDSPLALSRRRLLLALGATGAAAAVAGPLGAAPAAAAGNSAAQSGPVNPYSDNAHYYRGDHHIHSQYSPDAMNPVSRIVEKAKQYGLDWLVVTDHGGVTHQKLSIDQITPDIEAARAANPGTLLFQGLEWNIPGAEHATVFLPPTRNTVSILRAFEGAYDGAILATPTSAGGLGKITRATSSDGEPYALEALRFLDAQVLSGRVPIALFFANHPARRGLDSPHEFRNWREAAPSVAVGMEGAPGHQAAGLSLADGGIGSARGYYDFVAQPDSFPGYAPTDTDNPYRTYGGFDWLTAKVGGLWDSLLAEGSSWWVTSTSDSHQVHLDTLGQGTQDYPTTGSKGAPVPLAAPKPNGDFWPGFYSATIVTAHDRSYVSVMKGLQAGKIVAVHGRLIDALDLRVRAVTAGDRKGVTLGGRTFVERGTDVEVRIRVRLAGGPNANGDVPKLAKVDLIAGPITGPVTDRDTLSAPQTAVAETFSVPSNASGVVTFTHVFHNVQSAFYLRVRGSDGNRLTSSGGPVIDVVGDANPWKDLWFYANPVFVDVI